MTQTPQTSFEKMLRAQLKQVFVRTLVLRLASGLVSFVALFAWVFLLVVLWKGVVEAPAEGLTVIVSRASWAIAAVLFAVFVVGPVVRMPGLTRLARELERRRDFKDIVSSGYEFVGREDVARRYSPALVREVIRQAAESIRGLRVRFLFLDRRQAALVPVGYGAVLALIMFAFTSPSRLLDGGMVMMQPRAVAAARHEANLRATPGNITVLSGSDVEVSALDLGRTTAPVEISFELAEGFWKTEPAPARRVVVSGRPMNEYAYTFRDVRSSITYRFQADGRRSPDYRISVVHKPIVTEMQVVLIPPAYTGEPADTLIDSGGNVQALEGTHVWVTARSNNDLKQAWVRFDEGEPLPVGVTGREFAFDFQALEDGSYGITLEDELGHRTDEPLAYSVEVYQDNPPALDVLEPGADATLPRTQRLDVRVIASDDYGVDRADIFFRKAGEERFERKRIPLGPDAGKRDVAATFPWDLSDLALFPGNFVEYFVQVQDNNVVTGPGVTKSRVYHVKVPTMAELYTQVEEENTNRADLFEKAREEGEDLKDRLEKISREFKKSEKLDWTQKKEIDKAIASQEAIQEKLEEIQNSLDQTTESLSDNKMTSQEIGEKLEEINRLVDEINSEALNKYIDDLREAMEQLDPRKIQEALQNLEMSADDLLMSLERTESLLKEIQREQQMEELVRKTKDLMDKQEELQEKTEGADAQDEMSALSEDQEELANETKRLGEDLEKFAEKLEADKNEMAEEARETSKQFSGKETPQTMEKASRQLRNGDKSQAMQSQQQAQDDMIALFRRVMDMQQGMQMASQGRAAANLQRLARSTLEMSFKQEQLTERMREQVSTEQPDMKAMAHEQLSYLNAVTQLANEVSEIANKTLAVPQQLLNMVGIILQSMQNTLTFLEQNKAFLSMTSATEAVTGLNQVTIALLSAAQQCSQGGGGGAGMPQPGSAMEQLQQLLEGQRQIMQQTQQMLALRATQERLLQERQAAMQRLLGQQRSLQELADEIQKSTEKGDRVLGRMDRIQQEMREVIRDLENDVLNESTLQKEERIVSRLLDAQRSVHTRDYEKKRESVTGEDVYSSAMDTPGDRTSSQQLREEIRRAMTLKAPGEFEDLIKLYFRALAEDTVGESQ